MKKNLFYYLFAVICSVTLFTSCSDDDDEKMVNPVPQTTFTGENGLQLTYNGCLLYTSPSPRDAHESRMPSSA